MDTRGRVVSLFVQERMIEVVGDSLIEMFTRPNTDLGVKCCIPRITFASDQRQLSAVFCLRARFSGIILYAWCVGSENSSGHSAVLFYHYMVIY
jgi:hypothetical protein